MLGGEIIGIYLIGSLAHGGFSRRYSDIDIAVITGSGLSPAVLERMRLDAATVAADLASTLSIFWTDRTFSFGRFPPLDRIDYLDHAVTLVERVHLVPERPTIEEVRGYLAGEPFANWKKASQEFATCDYLDAKDRKSYLRALLYPARFVFSWATGRMDSNDVAVGYLSGEAPTGLDVDLVRRALACRQAASDPDFLFSDRTLLPRQVAACAAMMTAA
jgi:predicted nucleotidyltransferase